MFHILLVFNCCANAESGISTQRKQQKSKRGEEVKVFGQNTIPYLPDGDFGQNQRQAEPCGVKTFTSIMCRDIFAGGWVEG